MRLGLLSMEKPPELATRGKSSAHRTPWRLWLEDCWKSLPMAKPTHKVATQSQTSPRPQMNAKLLAASEPTPKLALIWRRCAWERVLWGDFLSIFVDSSSCALHVIVLPSDFPIPSPLRLGLDGDLPLRRQW